MGRPLKILMVEDSESDAALNIRALEAAGYDVSFELVSTAATMRSALGGQAFDLVLSDHSLPQFDSPSALALLQESGRDIPFIVVSGAIGEEMAVRLMKAGAQDYVMKGNLARLGPAVERELRDAEIRRERKRGEARLKETLERLRLAVTSTIQVLGRTVEARDPYTAGHQERTTRLAEAIAVEMGLDPEKIDGLRLAGQVHDLGKISIPAEILSKPTALNPVEYKLVKTHAQKGYEILREVEFPWPIAEIVYQHHERMDGSGYPRGLAGNNILLEARILSVSDTVEAMASHRPYRRAPGIQAALEEIEAKSGVLYDSDAAAACVRLFRTGGFAFEA